MTADDSRAVPDTEAVREALAWLRPFEPVADLEALLAAAAPARRHAATIVRAALARDVGTRERADAVTALRELVELKDGPRDDRYRARKDWAWTQARAALACDVPAGRDLTAQDVQAVPTHGWDDAEIVADYLNRIARGDQ